MQTVSLAAVAAGAAAGGGILSAASSIAAGINANRAAKISADQADRDAKLAVDQSKFAVRQERIKGGEIISAGTAITGASGVKIGRGSDLRIREVNQGRIETSISNILFSGRVAAFKLRSQAAILRAQGKAARTAGFIGGVTSILGSVSSIAGIKSNAAIMAKLKGSSTGFLDPSLGTAELRGEA